MKQSIAIDDAVKVEASPQTWTADVGVPLIQNVLGGVATAGIVALTWRAFGELPAEWWLPAALAGAGVACLATLTRFFADDVGIVAIAYKAGRRSRDAEVNALHLQVREAQDAMTMAGQRPEASTTMAKQLLVAQTTLTHARLLLQVAFSGDSIGRQAMAQRGVGQRDWERAMRLVKAAGVVDDLGQLRIRNHRQALRAVEDLHRSGYQTMEQRNNFRPAWY